MGDNKHETPVIKGIGFVQEQIEIIEGFRRSQSNKLNTSHQDGQSASEESQGNAKPVGPQNMTADIVVTNVDETGIPTSNEELRTTPDNVGELVLSDANDTSESTGFNATGKVYKDGTVDVDRVVNGEGIDIGSHPVRPSEGGALRQQNGGNELTKETANKIANALRDIKLPDSSGLKTKVDALVVMLNEYDESGDLTAIFEAADEVKAEVTNAKAEAKADELNTSVDPDGKGGGKRRSRRRRRHSSKKKKKKKSRRRKGSRRK